MKTIRIKRLWHGLASLRDYQVKKLIEENRSVKLVTFPNGEEEEMTLTVNDLKKGFQTVVSKFNSKFDKRQYSLVDFKWKKDDKTPDLFNERSNK